VFGATTKKMPYFEGKHHVFLDKTRHSNSVGLVIGPAAEKIGTGVTQTW